eukprot:9232241-Alexandrium_andersonii.AAC.1
MACRPPTDMSGQGPAVSSHAELVLGGPADSSWLCDAVRRSITKVGPSQGGDEVALRSTAAMHAHHGRRQRFVSPGHIAVSPCAVYLPGHARAPGH